MAKFKRLYMPEHPYFFTIVTQGRKHIFSNNENIVMLKESINFARGRSSFNLDAFVLLPDHLHALMSFRGKFCNYSEVWRLIKYKYTLLSNKKSIWQKNFWEHVIRDERDYYTHMDYIHYNPVKHGYSKKPFDYPYSSFKRYVQKGYYDKSWGCNPGKHIISLDFE